MNSLYDHIEDVIATGEKIPVALLKEKTRKSEVVFARQLIYTFASECQIASYSIISQRYNQDHASVSHALKSIYRYEKTDNIKCKKISYYRNIIKSIFKLNVKLVTLHTDLEILTNAINEIKKDIYYIEQMEMNLVNGTYLHNITLYKDPNEQLK